MIKTRERVDVYTLSTAYDISTCTFESTRHLEEEEREEQLILVMMVKRFFVFDQNIGTSDNYSVKQYSLTSAFDLSNPTLVKDYDGTNIKAH